MPLLKRKSKEVRCDLCGKILSADGRNDDRYCNPCWWMLLNHPFSPEPGETKCKYCKEMYSYDLHKTLNPFKEKIH